jgi:hypothetical protein
MNSAARLIFGLLPLLVWFYFTISFALHPSSQIWRTNFIDSDDYLYMVQAIDWLHGQPWFDLLQHRIDPPLGTPIHFSHLLNIPYGGLTAFLAHWFDLMDAATIAAAIYPLFYFALLLVALRWASKPLVTAPWENITAFTALFSLSLLLQFTPGRVDHHGLEAVLAIAAFGGVVQMMLSPAKTTWPIFTGIILAFALVIGLEILPVLILLCMVAGLWAAVEGKGAARNALYLSGTLFLASAGFLLLSQPVSALLTPSLQNYSIAYVVMLACMLVAFIAAYATSSMPSLRNRLTISLAAAVIGAVLFLLIFPDFIGGPYGGAEPATVRLIESYANEAWPLFKGPYYHRSLAFPVLAIASLITFYKDPSRERRWILGMLLLLIASSFLLAIFWQRRMIVFTEAFSVIAVARMADIGWHCASRFNDAWLTPAARIFLILLIGPLTVVMPYMLSPNIPAADTLFFPVQVTRKLCDENGLAAYLNVRENGQSHVIMSTIGQATELIYRTPDSVVGAPFHMNIDGNQDAYDFFTTKDATVAEQIAKRRHIDWVVACTNIEPFYKSGSADGPGNFIETIVNATPPAWLDKVTAPELGNMLLFHVKAP